MWAFVCYPELSYFGVISHHRRMMMSKWRALTTVNERQSFVMYRICLPLELGLTNEGCNDSLMTVTRIGFGAHIYRQVCFLCNGILEKSHFNL